VTDDVQDRTLADEADEAGTDPGPEQAAAPAAAAKGVPAVRRSSPATVRRQAKKEAARRAAEARRRAKRRQKNWSYAGIAAVVVVILVGGYLWLGGGNGKPSTSASLPAGCPSAAVSIDPALCSRPTVTKGDGAALSALKVTPLVTGTGPKVTAGQWITVNYTGVNYKTGNQFDSSWSRSAPATFQIGAGAVIAGWDQGIVGQTVGSRLQLDIPGSLAYPSATPGDDTAGDLRFVVDILSASDTSPPAAAN
jgi:peptidylprolyl isomerase